MYSKGNICDGQKLSCRLLLPNNMIYPDLIQTNRLLVLNLEYLKRFDFFILFKKVSLLCSLKKVNSLN